MSLYLDLWKNARALVVLKVIFDARRPMLLREIVSTTQGDDEAVSKYCNLLASMGLLTRVSAHSGWCLTSLGFSFLAPGQTLPEGFSQLPENPEKPENPVNSPESCLSTTINNTQQLKELIVEESGKSGFFSVNRRFFESIGVTQNQTTDFIAEHIDPCTVYDEWEKLKAKNKAWPGLLIKILTQRPKPLTDADREAQIKARDQERRRRYSQYDQERTE